MATRDLPPRRHVPFVGVLSCLLEVVFVNVPLEQKKAKLLLELVDLLPPIVTRGHQDVVDLVLQFGDLIVVVAMVLVPRESGGRSQHHDGQSQ